MMAMKGRHIITVSTEHRAVLDTCHHLEKHGCRDQLSAGSAGRTDRIWIHLKSAIRPDTILIAAMYANNETGVIQPVKAIGEMAKAQGVLFFTDATQALGKNQSLM